MREAYPSTYSYDVASASLSYSFVSHDGPALALRPPSDMPAAVSSGSFLYDASYSYDADASSSYAYASSYSYNHSALVGVDDDDGAAAADDAAVATASGGDDDDGVSFWLEPYVIVPLLMILLLPLMYLLRGYLPSFKVAPPPAADPAALARERRARRAEGIPLVDRGREAPAPATPPRKGRYDDPLEDAYDEGFDPEEAYDENPYAGSDMIDPAEDPGGPRYGTL